jgi:hypothetical protein
MWGKRLPPSAASHPTPVLGPAGLSSPSTISDESSPSNKKAPFRQLFSRPANSRKQGHQRGRNGIGQSEWGVGRGRGRESPTLAQSGCPPLQTSQELCQNKPRDPGEPDATTPANAARRIRADSAQTLNRNGPAKTRGRLFPSLVGISRNGHAGTRPLRRENQCRPTSSSP